MASVRGLSRRTFLRVGSGRDRRQPAGRVCAGRHRREATRRPSPPRRPSRAGCPRRPPLRPRAPPATAATGRCRQARRGGQAGRRCRLRQAGGEARREPDRQDRRRRRSCESKRPAKLGEAPMLAELVKAGKLPPVEQRVPEEPLVLKPLREAGKYGGTWRRASPARPTARTSTASWAREKPLHVDYTGYKIVPAVAKAWELSDGGKTIRLSLRKGMKWSDGAARSRPTTGCSGTRTCTRTRTSSRSRTPEMAINGKPGKIVKVDDTTVDFVFHEPYPMFVDVLSAFTQMGGGHWRWAARRGAASWGRTRRPTTSSSSCRSTPARTKIDARRRPPGSTAGSRLAASPRTTTQLNPEVPSLVGLADRHADQHAGLGAGAKPVLLGRRHRRQPASVHRQGPAQPRREPGGRQPARRSPASSTRWAATWTWPSCRSSWRTSRRATTRSSWTPRPTRPLAHPHQPELRRPIPRSAKWITNVDFRRALSMGIDRDQINEAFFLGMAHAKLADVRRRLARERRARVADQVVHPRHQAVERPAGQDRPVQEGLRGLPPPDRQRPATCASKSPPSRQPSCRTPRSWRWWPSSGRRSASSSTSRTPSAAWRTGPPRPTSTRCTSGAAATPTSSCGRATTCRPSRTSRSAARSTPRGMPRVARRARSRTTRSCSKRTTCSARAPAWRRPSANKLGQELKKLIVDQQWVIGTVGFYPVLRVISNKMGNVPDRYSWLTRVRTPGAAHPSTYYFKS